MTEKYRKQDLILFYENNDDDRLFSNAMVNLYTNRFIIDEESQHEVSGVYHLATGRNNFLYRVIETIVPVTLPWFPTKYQKDIKIFHDAFIKDPSEKLSLTAL